MVEVLQIELRRTIKATAYDTNGNQKEYSEVKVVQKAKFDDRVAERSRNTRDFFVQLHRKKNAELDGGRLFLKTDIETGRPLPWQLLQMQNEMLPSVNTPNILVRYDLVVQAYHEGLFGNSDEEIPALILPIYLTLDPQGPIDLGQEGLHARQETHQIQ